MIKMMMLMMMELLVRMVMVMILLMMVALVWSTIVPFPSVFMKYDTEDYDVAIHNDDIHDDDEGEDDDDSLKHWPLAVSGHPPIVSYPQIPTLYSSLLQDNVQNTVHNNVRSNVQDIVQNYVQNFTALHKKRNTGWASPYRILPRDSCTPLFMVQNTVSRQCSNIVQNFTALRYLKRKCLQFSSLVYKQHNKMGAAGHM